MKSYVFDIETDGLLDAMTCIHVLVLRDVETGEVLDFADAKYGSRSVEKGVRLLQDARCIVGHNSTKFDIPAIQKVFPWFRPAYVFTEDDIRNGRGHLDTLTLARLIWPAIGGKEGSDTKLIQKGKLPGKLYGSHGLEAWGHRLGLFKGDYKARKEEEAKALGMTEDRDIYEFVWGTWNQEMHDYCILDTEVTLELLKRAQRKAYEPRAVWLETRFAHILAEQERFGFGFDREAAGKLYSTLVGRRLELKGKLQDAFPPRYEPVETKAFGRTARYWRQHEHGSVTRLVKRKGLLPQEQRGFYEEQEQGNEFTRIEWVEFNPSSRQQIAKRLKEQGWEPQEFTDSGQPKIDETILEKLPYPEAAVLAEYFLVEKRIGQLAEGDQAWLRLESQGRIHGSVNTNGAVTGRCTHSNPNVAQVPKVGSPYGADCRALFVSTLGTLVGADLSGLELRCLAHFMARYDDGAYGRVLLDGDIHWANVVALSLTDDARNDALLIHKLFRNAAKTFIYAFLYGAGDLKIGLTIYELVIIPARKAQHNAWAELQHEFFGTYEVPTEAELTAGGKKLKATFMRKTPALKALKKAVTDKAKQGTIKGMDGRVLVIRSAHAALNTLLQSAGALIAKLATVFAYDELTTRGYIFGKDWALVAHIHDEMQADCKKEIADEVGTVLVDSMRKAGLFFGFRLPVDGEWKTGRNWCETH